MDKTKQKFKILRLKNCADNIAYIIEQASNKNLSPLQQLTVCWILR